MLAVVLGRAAPLRVEVDAVVIRMLTKSRRISHVLWATNEYLSACGKRDTDQCPLCGSARETNDHLNAKKNK